MKTCKPLDHWGRQRFGDSIIEEREVNNVIYWYEWFRIDSVWCRRVFKWRLRAGRPKTERRLCEGKKSLDANCRCGYIVPEQVNLRQYPEHANQKQFTNVRFRKFIPTGIEPVTFSTTMQIVGPPRSSEMIRMITRNWLYFVEFLLINPNLKSQS